MKITLELPDELSNSFFENSRAGSVIGERIIDKNAFLGLITNLNEFKAVDLPTSEEEKKRVFFKQLEGSAMEINDMIAGKIPKRSIYDFLDEL